MKFPDGGHCQCFTFTFFLLYCCPCGIQENRQRNDHVTIFQICDFNGRTGSDPDFISYNNHVRQSLDDRACNEILISNEVMDLCNVRSSKDNVVNAQGKRILNLCNSMDLRILNGRFGLDSGVYILIFVTRDWHF